MDHDTKSNYAPVLRSPLNGCLATVTAQVIALGLFFAPSAQANEDLAKQLQNPIAALISVPFQFNYDENIGPDDKGSQLTLNVQPVIPFDLSENWNLISRTIVPLKWSDDIADSNGDAGSDNGIGDIIQSLFFSPKAPTAGGWIWGAGPVFNIPTSNDTRYGPGEWAIGPTAVALRQVNGWTYGGLTNHLWSVSGDTDISQTLLQPFISYTTPDAWTFAVNTESTYDWEAEEWTVPINLLVSKVFNLGDQPISIQAGPRYYVDSTPNGADDWGFRFSVTFLFPK